jgi:hypothetical protein
MLLALMFMVVRHDLEVPPAAPADAPAEDFSGTRALAALAEVLGDQRPHPLGSAAGEAVATRIADHLRDLGLEPELHSVRACGRRSAACGRVSNVVVRLPGRGASGDAPALLLSAHHDSVSVGPGAGDDGSGVAVLLELARIFAAAGPESRRRPLILLFVDGEEYGLVGAEAFLQEHPWAEDVAYAVNLDSGGNDGLATLTRTSADNGPVIAALADALERPRAASVIATAYALTPYDTDFSAYDRAEIFALDFGIGEDKAPYHTPNDRLEDLSPGSVQHLGETALAAVVALDHLAIDDPEARAEVGDRVYLDVVGTRLWTAPAGLIPWLALGLLAALLALLARLRDPAMPASAWLWGAAAWVLQVVGAIAVGAALAWVLAVIAGAEMASYAAPVLPRIALWAAVFAVSAAIARRLAGRAPALTQWGGAWLCVAVIALVVALVDPGATVVLLPPLAAQLILAALGLLATGGSRLPTLAIVLGLAVPGFLWLEAALRIELLFGLGRHGGAIALAPVALLAALLGPLWAAAPRRLQRAGIALASLTAGVAAIVSVTTPAHSRERPRRLNLVLHCDAGAELEGDGERCRWLIGDRPGGPPGALLAAADFADSPAQSFPWSEEDDESWIAPAAAVDLPPPTLDLLSDEPGPWGRLLRLRLRSPRGARRAALLLPEDAGIRAITVDGVTLPPYPERKRERFPEAQHYQFVGVPAEGVEIAVIVAAPEGEAIEATIWDVADGLPDTPEAAALLRARPEDHVQTHGGDVSLVSRTVTLGGE